jgi:hypothetical protein
MAPTPVSVQQSHTLALSQAQAYQLALTAPLPEVFRRRHLLLPPIREVRDQPEPWGASVGQSRTIVTTDGGTMVEELVVLEPDERFGYVLSRVTGPMKPLVSSIEGQWSMVPAGPGTTITWAWTIHPRSALTAPVVRLLGSMWHTYAAQGLRELERLGSP